jgi:lipoic acid synthetase
LTSDRKPEWLKMPTIGDGSAGRVRKILRELELNTVCSSAKCPNRGHCFQRGTATFLILGRVCTRNCAYCAIGGEGEKPSPPDPREPFRVAQAAARMKLRYAVVTSVTRDDLPDGGAEAFAETVKALGEAVPGIRVEVLTPDFGGSAESLETVANAAPAVFNHNLETVERLFPLLRPVASYRQSLKVLEAFRGMAPDIPTKSGIMVGLGETREDVKGTMADLLERGVGILTIGQYLRPTGKHMAPVRYVTPEEFEEYRLTALDMGFSAVASGPLVRSSYHADLLRERT